MFGGSKLSCGELVDRTVSSQLSAQFPGYRVSLRLKGKRGFGTITARNHDGYLLRTCLQPTATTYLKALSKTDRSTS